MRNTRKGPICNLWTWKPWSACANVDEHRTSRSDCTVAQAQFVLLAFRIWHKGLFPKLRIVCLWGEIRKRSGPSCSKLTTSLVNDSLKFTLSGTQIFWYFFCWKNVSSFCSAKATHILSAKNIKILYIESAKTVNEMTLNELVKLTTLWTTGPSIFGWKESTFSGTMTSIQSGHPVILLARASILHCPFAVSVNTRSQAKLCGCKGWLGYPLFTSSIGYPHCTVSHVWSHFNPKSANRNC